MSIMRFPERRFAYAVAVVQLAGGPGSILGTGAHLCMNVLFPVARQAALELGAEEVLLLTDQR